MNFRTTYVLLGLVAAALVALAVFVTFTGDDAPSVSTEGYLLRAFRAAEVKPEKVTSVEIERPGETPDKFVFARDDKSWKLTSPSPARADGPALDALVVGLLNAKLEKSADVSTNLAVHGLDNPPVKVTLRAGPLSATIAIGNVTIGGDRAVVYVTTSDNPDLPQAVRRGDFQALFKSDAPRSATSAGQLVKGITEFRPLKLLGDGLLDPVNQVRSLSVRAAGDELAIFRTAENVWKFRLPADFGEAEVDGLGPQGDVKDGKVAVSSIRQLLNQIADIRPGTHKQFIETPGPLAAYGLDPAKNKPMQIDLSRDDGVKETLFVGEEVKKEGTDRFYARHEADPNLVVEVNASAVRAVQGAMKAKQLLRDRTVLRIAPNEWTPLMSKRMGRNLNFVSSARSGRFMTVKGKNGRPAKPRWTLC